MKIIICGCLYDRVIITAIILILIVIIKWVYSGLVWQHFCILMDQQFHKFTIKNGTQSTFSSGKG